jgi:hypothetical protein
MDSQFPQQNSQTAKSSASLSRRDMIKTTGALASVMAMQSALTSGIYAGGLDETVNVAIVGCGGRGTGAIKNAFNSTVAGTKLVAMADVFPEKMSNSFNSLQTHASHKVDVPEEHKFIGFDGYQKAMDVLKPGDVVVLTTPPAFRWVQFKYAIEKGLNVFMEKPVSVDGPTSRKMLALAEEADKKGLKVGVGLMCRHCASRGELHKRIQNGDMGDILALRAYRLAGPTGSADVKPNTDPKLSELMYQVRNFHGFLWLSGGCYSDFLIHNIDECCWMKNDWPVKAIASGGRHYRGESVDQNFDTYSVEYTFKDGTKLFLGGRTMPGCYTDFASYAHGTKGSAIISTAGHHPSKAKLYSSLDFNNDHLVWKAERNEPNPYDLEWDHFLDAIRNNKPYNEVKRGTQASLVTAMGRHAAHTGREITYEEMLNHEHEFAPGVDKLTLDSASPLPAMSNGKYPIPMPGIITKREYDVL